MSLTTTMELTPNNSLLDSNFDGYKLTLEDIKYTRKNLDLPVDKRMLNCDQYSFLHAKLFGFHNHLFNDQYDSRGAVYFIDKEFNVLKSYIDSSTNELVDPVNIFRIPKSRDPKIGDYNVTLRFASDQHAVACDGMGIVYLLETNEKRDDDEFKILFAGKILDKEEQGFIISDALYNMENKELHVLLLQIEEDAVQHFVSVIHWVTFKENSKEWEQVALRQLKCKGGIEYLQFEKGCEHIYVISEDSPEFLSNSRYCMQKDDTVDNALSKKGYEWSQTSEEINVILCLPGNVEKQLLKVHSEPKRIEIVYNSVVLLLGELQGTIDSTLTTWILKSGNILNITLRKIKGTGDWTELVIGNRNGEYQKKNNVSEQDTINLQGFASQNEVCSSVPATFSSQQMEDCDVESDKLETFERINGITNKTTHRIFLGTNHLLLSTHLNPECSPALGIKHDVDVCIWQPTLEDGFVMKHEGTLLAFSYVQASKKNRKFITCSPNLDYAVICESSGHIFIYRQNKPLRSAELRHRSSRRKIEHIAQQQVFSLPQQDILGTFASNSHFFVLLESSLLALNMNSSTE